VGQPAPWASTLRGDGDALYTNSILALDLKTGKIRWHFQVVPADNWDMDSPYESTLVDLPINGVTRKALIHTSKIGWGVVLDRATGQFIQSFKTAYDNIITGWSPTGAYLQSRRCSHTGDCRFRKDLRGLPAFSRSAKPERPQL
jgi:alcohol dehydrogenase (cytochrome c)